MAKRWSPEWFDELRRQLPRYLSNCGHCSATQTVLSWNDAGTRRASCSACGHQFKPEAIDATAATYESLDAKRSVQDPLDAMKDVVDAWPEPIRKAAYKYLYNQYHIRIDHCR